MRNLTNIGEFDFSSNYPTTVIVGSTFKPQYHGISPQGTPIDTPDKFIIHYICNTVVNGDDWGFSCNDIELSADEFIKIFGSIDNFKELSYKPVFFITVPHPDPKKKAKGQVVLQAVVPNPSIPLVSNKPTDKK